VSCCYFLIVHSIQIPLWFYTKVECNSFSVVQVSNPIERQIVRLRSKAIAIVCRPILPLSSLKMILPPHYRIFRGSFGKEDLEWMYLLSLRGILKRRSGVAFKCKNWLARAIIISVHVPYNKKTHEMFWWTVVNKNEKRVIFVIRLEEKW